jgi:molecular chaperone HscB
VRDYFALFAQPRRPWLNLEELEQKYRELARKTHPDQSAQPAGEFAEVNEAYQTLRDPKARLQHLLALEARPQLAATAEVPADLTDLFMKIAPALVNKKQEELDRLSKAVSDYYDNAIEQLHQLDKDWHTHASWSVSAAEKLCGRFAFLIRWKNLIEEHRFSISS